MAGRENGMRRAIVFRRCSRFVCQDVLLIYREIAGVRDKVGAYAVPMCRGLFGRISNELCCPGYDRSGAMRSEDSRFDRLELMCASDGRLKPNMNLAISQPAQ